MTLHEINKPIGQFILDNAEGVQLPDGAYYHYSKVCELLKKYACMCCEASLQKAAENATIIVTQDCYNNTHDVIGVHKQSITSSENICIL